MRTRGVAALFVVGTVAGPGSTLAPSGGPDAAPIPWGRTGHEIAARAAHVTLPAGMPGFFLDAGEQLVYLDPEPDRWRDRALVEMDQAWSYDHYTNLENVPAGALDAPDRFVYLKALYDAGLEKPERDAGFLPFRIVELYQRLVTEWRMWHAESDPERKRWIEARIIDDAGILGHYVTDASQPHHTTIHFNGWSSDAPNPVGYTEDRAFHARFESEFVDAHVSRADVDSLVPAEARSVAGAARGAVLAYIRETHAMVESLYRLDMEVGFDPGAPPHPRARAFAAERLAAGASMLAVLWRSAWEEGRGRPSPA
jgi:hypothetical protein